jgi:hypothetical protein
MHFYTLTYAYRSKLSPSKYFDTEQEAHQYDIRCATSELFSDPYHQILPQERAAIIYLAKQFEGDAISEPIEQEATCAQ